MQCVYSGVVGLTSQVCFCVIDPDEMAYWLKFLKLTGERYTVLFRELQRGPPNVQVPECEPSFTLINFDLKAQGLPAFTRAVEVRAHSLRTSVIEVVNVTNDQRVDYSRQRYWCLVRWGALTRLEKFTNSLLFNGH
jgi:hypothetical protein